MSYMLIENEIRVLEYLAKAQPGYQPTHELIAEELGFSASNSHRIVLRLAEAGYVDLQSRRGQRTRFQISEAGRDKIDNATDRERLSKFFREERPDLGWEGDVEGWDPVECAIQNLRRKPRENGETHG